jgi:4-alpha-glucanotransferase
VGTDSWGIDDGYWDWAGRWRNAPAATLERLRAVMGPPAEPEEVVWTVTQGTPASIGDPAELRLEAGGRMAVRGALPDLPLGRHRLVFDDAHAVQLVVVPPRCPAPERPGWGLAVQLYAARSRRSWGIGDLGDLATLGAWCTDQGAACLLLNPLGSTGTQLPQQPSPYYPSSRLFRSVLYLCIDEVPGAAELEGDLAPLASAAHDLLAQRRIDRDAVLRLKLAALERLWRKARNDDETLAALAAFRAAGGPVLEAFGVHAALAERHGASWRTWPSELRHPGAHAVARAGVELADRVAFHLWCQWQLDRQLAAAAAAGPGLVLDLPVGFDPGGFDAWWWQDLLAIDCSVGAPPDEFNGNGQDWGLPPFVPNRLAAAGFEPFTTTVRTAMRHARGLRIDHVMGLWRLWWVPEGGSPRDGAYVRYDGRTLLGLLALEARRAGCFVVGEDLGTVEDAVRDDLAAHGVLSTRLVWFEDRSPPEYPTQSIASVTTHDLPTVAGLWTGADHDAQVAAGVPTNDEGDAELRRRLVALTGAGEAAPVAAVDQAVHRALGTAASVLVLATLDDVAGVEERPNLPGTVDEAPNWRLALPAPLEELMVDPAALAIVEALVEGRERRGAAAPGPG